jgi:hypothetical protein
MLVNNLKIKTTPTLGIAYGKGNLNVHDFQEVRRKISPKKILPNVVQDSR